MYCSLLLHPFQASYGVTRVNVQFVLGIQVIPILRAGLVLLEQAQQVLPAHETFHVGYVRDETTLIAK
jgi:uracil phosphoribosyltransferase